MGYDPRRRPGIEGLLSEGGSEFEGKRNPALLDVSEIPKMNAHNEWFNRTLKEQFVDYHGDLLFTDLEGFNRKLAEWLVDYNTVLPHHSLGLKSSAGWLLENYTE